MCKNSFLQFRLYHSYQWNHNATSIKQIPYSRIIHNNPSIRFNPELSVPATRLIARCAIFQPPRSYSLYTALKAFKAIKLASSLALHGFRARATKGAQLQHPRGSSIICSALTSKRCSTHTHTHACAREREREQMQFAAVGQNAAHRIIEGPRELMARRARSCPLCKRSLQALYFRARGAWFH